MTAPLITAHGSSRVGALDAVRGVAIIGVIATHSVSAVVATTGSYAIPTSVFWASVYGQFGVQLFFVLSGWLIFSLYTGDRPFSQRAYWARRWARIWPLWALFLVLSYVFIAVPDSGLPVWLGMLLGLVFLGWLNPALVAVPIGGLTIQQEMGHYTLFALFRRRSVAFLAGTVIVGYLSAYAARAIVPIVGPDSVIGWAMEAWLRLSLFTSWPFFLLGAAGYATFRRWRRDGIEGLLPQRSWASALVFVALLLSFFTTYAEDTPGYFVLGFVLICVGVAVMGNLLPVVGPMLRSIGRYSYFMYFFHFWVLRWFEQGYREAGLPGGDTTSMLYNTALLAALLVGVTAVSWAVGWISWHLLEKRILAWAHRVVPEPPRSTPPAAA